MDAATPHRPALVERAARRRPRSPSTPPATTATAPSSTRACDALRDAGLLARRRPRRARRWRRHDRRADRRAARARPPLRLDRARHRDAPARHRPSPPGATAGACPAPRRPCADRRRRDPARVHRRRRLHPPPRRRDQGRRRLPGVGRKAFASQSPAGAVLSTMFRYDDPDQGRRVLNMAVPIASRASPCSTTGTPSACAAPAATTSSSRTCSCPTSGCWPTARTA